VADGSLVDEKSAWAAIMNNKQGIEWACQQGQGAHNNLSSYRVKLEGCLSPIKLTKTIPNTQLCKLYRNNKAIIQSINTITQRQPSLGGQTIKY
jgi:hypothetical protein